MHSDETIARDFTVVMRGYDRSEVDRHLAMTARGVAALRERVDELEAALEEARATASTQSASAERTIDEDASPKELFGALGEETTRILVAAEESAREMRERAARQAEAEITAAERASRDRVTAATDHAARIVHEAEQRRDDVVADTEDRIAAAERELTRLEGVRTDLVDQLRSAIEATTAAVAELAPTDAAVTRDDGARGLVVGEEAPDTEGAAATVDDSDGATAHADAPAEPSSEREDPRSVAGDEPATERTVPDTRAAADEGEHGATHEGADRAGQAEGDDDGGAAADEPAAGRRANVIVIDAMDDVPPGTLFDPSAGDDTGTGPAAAEEVTAAAVALEDRASSGARAAERHGAAPDALRSALDAATVAAAVDDPDVDEDLTPTERRDRSLATIRPAALRGLRRALQDIQNSVLRRIRERDDGDATTLLPGEDASSTIAVVASSAVEAAGRAGIVDAAAIAGRADADAGEPLDATAVSDATDELAADLLGELRTTLAPSLDAGIEAGEPDASLSERVGEVFRDLKGPVVETVLDRHLTHGYGVATIATWRALDVDRVVWLLGEESRCPEGKCRTNAAEGPVGVGVAFPSGDAVPQVHDGCTCALAPAPG